MFRVGGGGRGGANDDEYDDRGGRRRWNEDRGGGTVDTSYCAEARQMALYGLLQEETIDSWRCSSEVRQIDRSEKEQALFTIS